MWRIKKDGVLDRLLMMIVLFSIVTLLAGIILRLADIRVGMPVFIQWMIWFGALPLAYMWLRLSGRKD